MASPRLGATVPRPRSAPRAAAPAVGGHRSNRLRTRPGACGRGAVRVGRERRRARGAGPGLDRRGAPAGRPPARAGARRSAADAHLAARRLLVRGGLDGGARGHAGRDPGRSPGPAGAARRGPDGAGPPLPASTGRARVGGARRRDPGPDALPAARRAGAARRRSADRVGRRSATAVRWRMAGLARRGGRHDPGRRCLAALDGRGPGPSPGPRGRHRDRARLPADRSSGAWGPEEPPHKIRTECSAGLPVEAKAGSCRNTRGIRRLSNAGIGRQSGAARRGAILWGGS